MCRMVRYDILLMSPIARAEYLVFLSESNPDVMNKYVAKMGWPAGSYRYILTYLFGFWAEINSSSSQSNSHMFLQRTKEPGLVTQGTSARAGSIQVGIRLQSPWGWGCAWAMVFEKHFWGPFASWAKKGPAVRIKTLHSRPCVLEPWSEVGVQRNLGYIQYIL